MLERLDDLHAELSWRIGGDWTVVDSHGRAALEHTDRHGRRYRLIPHELGGVYGTVSLLEHPELYLEGAVIDTYGSTGYEAVQRGRERLAAHLEEIAELHELDPPKLSGGTTARRPAPDDAPDDDQSAPDAEQTELC